jgi:phosphatidylinositol 4-kinase B
MAVSIVTVLYILANVAYFAALSKSEIAKSKVVVAADFFEKVWGAGAFPSRVMPLMIALSAIGNVFAQSFAMPRVKQEFGKEGILPFSRFWASDWPCKAPSGALLLHWVFSVALILGSSTSDTYSFVTNIFIYSTNWIKFFLAIGLLYLTFKLEENWRDQRTTFRNFPPVTIFYAISLLFTLAVPFVPNNTLAHIPFYVIPTMGTGIMVVGSLYWFIWAKILPLAGWHVQHEVQLLPDGSERVKYIVSRIRVLHKLRPREPGGANTFPPACPFEFEASQEESNSGAVKDLETVSGVSKPRTE